MALETDLRDSNDSATGTQRRAIVIGAGIGGLLASRVLADAYDEVLILERDTLPASGEGRKGIPQGAHVHALMSRGGEILETQFPGITDELVGHGALRGDQVADSRWYQDGGYHRNPASSLHALAMSRPLLEGIIRQRVLQRPNVVMQERTAVKGLLATADRSRVTGVRISEGPDHNDHEDIPADLVVDASGRGSHLPAWLQTLGFDAPEERHTGVATHYASRLFRRRPEDLDGKLAVVVASTSTVPRGGVALAQEGDHWIVTLAGRKDEHPPTDLDAFIDFARSLPAREIFEIVSTAEPRGDAAVYSFRSDQRRDYDQLARFPEGILPFADSICAFNPVYAQGMSIAAIEAEALTQCIAAGTDQLAKRFFGAISRDIDSAWMLAAGADKRFITAPEDLPRQERMVNGYLDRLHVAARVDPAVSIAFREVVNLQRPPTSLMRPSIMMRVLVANLRQRRLVADDRGTDPGRALPDHAVVTP